MLLALLPVACSTLSTRLQVGSQVSQGGHSCIAAASQTVTLAVMVSADAFKWAGQRAGDLVGNADQPASRIDPQASFRVIRQAGVTKTAFSMAYLRH